MSIGILNLKLYGKFMNNTPRLYVAAALLAMYRFDNVHIVPFIIT